MNKVKKLERLVGCLVVLLAFAEMNAATLYARNNGDWDQLNKWSNERVGGASCDCLPGPNDDVIIDGFHLVIDNNSGNITINSLAIRANQENAYSELRIVNGMALTIKTDLIIDRKSIDEDQFLLVLENGTLYVGGDYIIDQTTEESMDFSLNISEPAIYEDEARSNITINQNSFLKTINIDNNGIKEISENKLFKANGEEIRNYEKTTTICTSDIAPGMYSLKSYDAKGSLIHTSKLMIQ